MLIKMYRWLDLNPDISLSRDEASRFLPWIISLMVYLTALVLAGGFTLNQTITASHNAQMESFSVHVPFIEDKEQQSDLVDKTVAALKTIPVAIDVKPMSVDKIKALVEPWLGKSDAISNLPLPVIIDVKLKKDTTVDLEKLKTKLQNIHPDISMDDHKKWVKQFTDFIAIIQATLLMVALFIIAATACVVIFACKTSLKIHRNTVNLLHRLGAFDAYIAKQFQDHAALLTLKGAFIGSGLAAATLLGLHVMAQNINSPLFPALRFSFIHWCILFFLPILMSVLALISARISVLRTLQRIP